MDSLDDKVLIRIFRLVSQEDERKLFRVCKRWQRLMDNSVGIRVEIGQHIEVVLYEPTPDSMKILEQVGIRSCEVYCLINETASLPKLKHPDLLEVVSFKNFVSSQSFTSILTGVKNLRIFQIDQTAIFYLEFSELKLSSIPCQVLHIQYTVEFSPFDPCHKESEYEALNINTIHFLRWSFPGLKVAIVCLTVLEHNYDWITRELANFLNKHSGGLTDVYISLREKKDYLMDDTEDYVRAAPSAFQPIQDAQFCQLQSIAISDECSPEKKFDWMGWVLNKPDFETSKHKNVRMFEINPRISVQDKKETVIKSIIVLLSTPCKLLNTFDCAIFKDCFQLDTLMIRADGCYCRVPQDKPFYEGLLNADQLPKSIETLIISGLAITCETCEALCFQLPALEMLELTENAGTKGYGVTRDVTEKIIQEKKIKEFNIEVGVGIRQFPDSSDQLLDQAYNCKLPSRRIIGKLEIDGAYKLEISEPQNTIFSRHI